jgi:hypothetical protein
MMLRKDARAKKHGKQVRKALLCLAVGFFLAIAGCAPPPYQPRPVEEYTGMGVPPSYYDNDPAMAHWFTAPYFDPYITGR